MSHVFCQVHNEGGQKRVLVTKNLPGERWLKLLTSSDCRVEVCTSPKTILSNDDIKKLIGDKCDGVIGQLTEVGVIEACSVLREVLTSNIMRETQQPALRRGGMPICLSR
jgi:glycerate dehydrogenase